MKHEVLTRVGVDSPYVFSVGSMEFRKNVWGLIDAFAALPKAMRATHQLVLAYAPNPDEIDGIRAYARSRGVGDRVIVIGWANDKVLVPLYRNCSAFIFPSRYEGFGLPVLEGMLCGAPTIAGNNSSMIEIVGDAGLLANPDSVDDIRDKIHAILADPALAADFRRRGPIQGANFTWKKTAGRRDRGDRPPRDGPDADLPGRSRPRPEAPDRDLLALAAPTLGDRLLRGATDRDPQGPLHDRRLPRRRL